MKLKYWIANCTYDVLATDGSDYSYQSVRARTKKECLAMRDCRLIGMSPSILRFSEPHQVTIHYGDVFHLMLQATSEGGLYEHDD